LLGLVGCGCHSRRVESLRGEDVCDAWDAVGVVLDLGVGYLLCGCGEGCGGGLGGGVWVHVEGGGCGVGDGCIDHGLLVHIRLDVLV